ncbi:hypothetical protein EIP91_008353 [Steccherinum ochraceum]|uniref:Uncharacterized protein n=1 Tax=Steccherinum ochraceum TaxID=92696 RepID=A0A4R0RKM5_9APHY|nr:hypothetical protein EIP91_008353 [Steccherinum ochraceum]
MPPNQKLETHLARISIGRSKDGSTSKDGYKTRLRAVTLFLLHELTGDKTLTMSYNRCFHQNIRKDQRITIEYDSKRWSGKTLDFFIKDPNEYFLFELEKLLLSWRNGTIRYRYMSLEEWAGMEAVEKPKRKVRDDKDRRRQLRPKETRGAKRRPQSGIKTPRYVIDSEDEIEAAEDVQKYDPNWMDSEDPIEESD